MKPKKLDKPATRGRRIIPESVNKGGRPSPFEGRELEIAEAVAERMKTGETLTSILRTPGMPAESTFDEWRVKYPKTVGGVIARARLIGFDAIAESTIATAEDRSLDEEQPQAIQRDRLIIETKLKLLAKWDPKRYGDKIAVENSGEVIHVEMSEARREELMKRRRAALEFGRS